MLKLFMFLYISRNWLKNIIGKRKILFIREGNKQKIFKSDVNKKCVIEIYLMKIIKFSIKV